MLLLSAKGAASSSLSLAQEAPGGGTGPHIKSPAAADPIIGQKHGVCNEVALPLQHNMR
jgi:hypothetical protein